MNEALKRDIEQEQENCRDEGDDTTYLFQLEKILIEHENAGTEAKWFNCGICRGRGSNDEWGEVWKCGNCDGREGSWS